MKHRIDQLIYEKKLTSSRSQAENFIRLGKVTVDGKVVTKPGYFVSDSADIVIGTDDRFVSRAALKLQSVSMQLGIDFNNKTVLDVGSSTGGFTDYALQNGADNVVAVELGTNQLHDSLRGNPKIELHEKTDIRDYANKFAGNKKIDVVVADVSFISLRQILPSIASLSNKNTDIYAMVKPQFEAVNSNLKHKGVIKNDKIRRQILKDFESWSQNLFIIVQKSDSQVTGAKGNLERFYHLRIFS